MGMGRHVPCGDRGARGPPHRLPDKTVTALDKVLLPRLTLLLPLASRSPTYPRPSPHPLLLIGKLALGPDSPAPFRPFSQDPCRVAIFINVNDTSRSARNGHVRTQAGQSQRWCVGASDMPASAPKKDGSRIIRSHRVVKVAGTWICVTHLVLGPLNADDPAGFLVRLGVQPDPLLEFINGFAPTKVDEEAGFPY